MRRAQEHELRGGASGPEDLRGPVLVLTHLHGVGVVLRAAHHSAAPVEARWGLEGDCEVVGLRDVLHGRRVGVRLQDGGKLKGQDEGEQLLQQSGQEEKIKEDGDPAVRREEPRTHFLRNISTLN